MHCHTQQNVTANRVNFNVILRIRHVGSAMCHVCDSCNFNCITSFRCITFCISFFSSFSSIYKI